MKASLEILFKLTLAILLFGCLLKMPYGYFQLVRFISFIFFLLFAYGYSTKDRKTEVLICISIALLFQPFYKIALGRQLWNIVDVIVAIVLLISVFYMRLRIFDNGKVNTETKNQHGANNGYSSVDRTAKKDIKMHIEKGNES